MHRQTSEARRKSLTPYDPISADSREEVKRLFNLIKEMISEGTIGVKQLIDEKNYSWIHISYQDGRTTTHNQVLHLL